MSKILITILTSLILFIQSVEITYALRPPSSKCDDAQTATTITQTHRLNEDDTKKTVMTIALEHFKHTVDIMGIHPIIADIISKPERIFIVEPKIILDDDLTGYKSRWVRSRHSTYRGPGKGGIRFTSNEITQREIQNANGLAFNMSEKNSGSALPMGGAKGEAQVDIRKLNPNEIARNTKEGIWQLMEQFEALGEDIDIPAPDQDTNETIMAYMTEAYLAWKLIRKKSLKNKEATEVILGDPGIQQALSFYSDNYKRIRRKHTEDGKIFADTRTPVLDKTAELESKGYIIPELGAFTGKPIHRGGAKGRREATGLGGYYAEVAGAKHYAKEGAEPFTGHVGVEDLWHNLRGLGNVGLIYAKQTYYSGGKFAAIQILGSGIKFVGPKGSKGIDIDKLSRFIMKERRKIYQRELEKALQGNPDMTKQEKGDLWQLIQKRNVDLTLYKQDNVVAMSEGEDIVDIEADILVEAATHCTINAITAKKIKQKVILELGNATTTRTADKILAKRGIMVIPDILANVGGATVSMYEAKQNFTGVKWPRVLTYARLEERINRAMDKMFEISSKHGLSNRDAHRVISQKRIIDALYARMWRNKDPRLSNINAPYATWVRDIYTSPETDEELMWLCASGEAVLQKAIDDEEVDRHTRLMSIAKEMFSYFGKTNQKEDSIKICLIGGPTGYKVMLAEYMRHILETRHDIHTIYLDLDSAKNIEALPRLLKGEPVEIVKSAFDDASTTVELKPGDIIVAEGSFAIADNILDSLPDKEACFPIAVDIMPCMKVRISDDPQDTRSVMLTNDDYTQLRELLVSFFQREKGANPYNALLSSIRHKKIAIKHIYSTFRNKATVIFNTYDPLELLFVKDIAMPLLEAAQQEAYARRAKEERKSLKYKRANEVYNLAEYLKTILEKIPDIKHMRNLYLPRGAPIRQILPKYMLDTTAAMHLSLHDILVSRDWENIFEAKDISGEAILFNNISIYNPDFCSLKIDDKHKLVDGKLSIGEGEGFILVCNPEETNIKEIITKGCSICVAVSIAAPLAGGRWAFYISHFLNYEDDDRQNRAQGGKEVSGCDEVRKTLDEALGILEQLGADKKNMKGAVVGGCGDLGIMYLGEAVSFFDENGIVFNSQHAGGLKQQNRGLKINVVTKTATPLVQSSSNARYEEAQMEPPQKMVPFSTGIMENREVFEVMGAAA